MPKLFYIIGASGAGKDSAINYARDKLADNAKTIFAHRYITRSAHAGGENHIALSVPEFLNRKQHGLFSMSWFSHQTHYAIGIELEYWLSEGLNIVMNGSRGHLQQATQRFDNLIPVLLSVKKDILRQRLIDRARENRKKIEQRLMQADELQKNLYHPKLITIENNSSISVAGDQMVRVITDA